MKTLFKKVFLFSSVVCLSLPFFADVDTTSGMRGTVNVSGATVVAEHTPTGITKTTTSGSSGSFRLTFLPLGGPYTVKITAPGYDSESIDGLYLNLGDPLSFGVTLTSSSAADEIVVTAKPAEAFKMGTSTVLTRDDMNAIPTINRSVADFAKMDPRVSVNGGVGRDAEISVMGANTKFNDFTIDGVSFNDPFGLNDNGFGTMKNPVSMDFVDQISVDITPFDVSRGNTTGGSIAVVTKSGTNEFHGSAFYQNRDEGNVGDYLGEDFPEFEDEVMAFTFAGPIIKDRLFFFVGYEENTTSLPGLYGTVDSNAQIKGETVTTALANEIRQYTIDNYGGYDAGYINLVTFDETHEEWTVKLDAVISDDHRATLNLSHSEDLTPQRYNYGETVFSNNWYYKPPEIDRASFTLYSDWSDRLSTKFKYTSYEMEEDDASYGDDFFPEMNIRIGGDNVFLGGDRYRGANLINVESEFLTLKADYDNDDHLYTVGYESDNSDVVNLFIARYNGEVRFDSFEDYKNGIWSRLRIHEPYAGHDAVGTMAADFEVEKTSLYIQDKWFVNNDLTVMFGLRYDAVETPIAPATNVNFVKEYGFSNAETFDFNLLQPRFSFNMDATDFFSNRENVVAATLRGGRGLFMGRIPRVWYGNAYSRTGATGDYRGWYDYDTSASNFPGPMPKGDPTAFWLGAGSKYTVPSGDSPYGVAQSTDPNFEAPSSWRTSLALDILTQGGWDVTLEYNLDEVRQAIFFTDLGLEQEGTLADGRGIYGGRGDYRLTNTDQGTTEAWTISTAKQFGDVNWFAGYTKMRANDVFELTSAQSESSYGRSVRADGENINAARSNFMVEHKFISSLDYTTQLIGNNDTRFSLVYVRKSGEPYSVTFDGYDDAFANDRSDGGYDAAYIPTGASDPNVVFASTAVADAVMAHVNSSGLSSYKGTIVPRNAFNSPWNSSLDLRITQDIEVMEGHKVIVYLDITNLLNLIDDDKGIITEYSNRSRQIELDRDNPYDSEGRYNIVGVDPDDGLRVYNNNGQSSYQWNLGFKYQF
ncbi:TonB-dependent receptor [Gammaproteobacteria bacterium]|nr:TonB-dependent receptor [Gammaproteobacteria bacterium]MDC0577181.1 TonB-dependent receptor [Gammaproteobacteria bacterium]MDC1251711.1 TonB-dependent receptor [Gammaproteobacteria bacterium]|tara:strand:+ start:7464 stop:10583 length:3120 start_codon:yes stop_codon:yes gene_type:complete